MSGLKGSGIVKISIIMPIYNVEGYLKKCMDSILNQTLSDFELIAVDDGSTDSSGKIADEYEKKDSRVCVIHKENGGAPSARNAGINIVRGDYLYFPDSDDWLEPTYLEELYDLATKTNAQMVISGYTMEYFEQNKEQSYCVTTPFMNYGTQESLRKNLHNYFDNMMIAVPWNKLYQAEWIKKNGLLFPMIKWDDLHFNMEVLKEIESVCISPACGYHFFRSRQGSETTIVFDGMLFQKRKEQFEHILKVYKYWDIKEQEIMSSIYGYYAARLVQCVQEIAISDCENKRQLINEVLDDEMSKEAFLEGEISSKLLRIVAWPMKKGNVGLSFLAGWAIGFVKGHFPALFYRMKSQSVNGAYIPKDDELKL